MLVDFRGFDTLGEITVLGVVGADGVRAAAALPARRARAIERRRSSSALQPDAAAPTCVNPRTRQRHGASAT